jgi:hypothetical protein
MAVISTYMVSSNQSFYDLSIQFYGNPNYAFEIATANNRLITDWIEVGAVLVLPDLEKNNYVLKSLASRGNNPATDFFPKTENQPLGGGIDEWQIEVDFVVSENID